MIALAMVAAGGCGGEKDPYKRVAVSGKVTLDGAPLEAGIITFSPADGSDPVVSAPVENGSYALTEKDGPQAGLHNVSILSRKTTVRTERNPDDPTDVTEYPVNEIPTRYNLQTNLTVELRDGDNALPDYNLETSD